MHRDIFQKHFFLLGFSFTDTDNSLTGQQGKGEDRANANQ